MFVIFLFVSAFLMSGIAAQSNTTCARDRWGPPDCMNVCGNCYVSDSRARVCDIESGKCEHDCAGGFIGDDCTEAKCSSGCGEGLCIGFDICANCGDINKVPPKCEDVRLRGLIGSAIAFAVITAAVSFCGLGAVWYRRRTRKSVSL